MDALTSSDRPRVLSFFPNPLQWDTASTSRAHTDEVGDQPESSDAAIRRSVAARNQRIRLADPKEDEDLHQKRLGSVQRLQSSWELLKTKYGDVGLEDDDEIDLRTGQIVTNRGRVEKMEPAEFGSFKPEDADLSDDDEDGDFGDSDNDEDGDLEVEDSSEDDGQRRLPRWTSKEDVEALDEFLKIDAERQEAFAKATAEEETAADLAREASEVQKMRSQSTAHLIAPTRPITDSTPGLCSELSSANSDTYPTTPSEKDDEFANNKDTLKVLPAPPSISFNPLALNPDNYYPTLQPYWGGKGYRRCRPCTEAGGDRAAKALYCKGRTSWKSCTYHDGTPLRDNALPIARKRKSDTDSLSDDSSRLAPVANSYLPTPLIDKKGHMRICPLCREAGGDSAEMAAFCRGRNNRSFCTFFVENGSQLIQKVKRRNSIDSSVVSQGTADTRDLAEDKSPSGGFEERDSGDEGLGELSQTAVGEQPIPVDDPEIEDHDDRYPSLVGDHYPRPDHDSGSSTDNGRYPSLPPTIEMGQTLSPVEEPDIPIQQTNTRVSLDDLVGEDGPTVMPEMNYYTGEVEAPHWKSPAPPCPSSPPQSHSSPFARTKKRRFNVSKFRLPSPSTSQDILSAEEVDETYLPTLTYRKNKNEAGLRECPLCRRAGGERREKAVYCRGRGWARYCPFITERERRKYGDPETFGHESTCRSAGKYHTNVLYQNDGIPRRCRQCRDAGGERAEKAAQCPGRVWAKHCIRQSETQAVDVERIHSVTVAPLSRDQSCDEQTPIDSGQAYYSPLDQDDQHDATSADSERYPAHESGAMNQDMRSHSRPRSSEPQDWYPENESNHDMPYPPLSAWSPEHAQDRDLVTAELQPPLQGSRDGNLSEGDVSEASSEDWIQWVEPSEEDLAMGYRNNQTWSRPDRPDGLRKCLACFSSTDERASKAIYCPGRMRPKACLFSEERLGAYEARQIAREARKMAKGQQLRIRNQAFPQTASIVHPHRAKATIPGSEIRAPPLPKLEYVDTLLYANDGVTPRVCTVCLAAGGNRQIKAGYCPGRGWKNFCLFYQSQSPRQEREESLIQRNEMPTIGHVAIARAPEHLKSAAAADTHTLDNAETLPEQPLSPQAGPAAPSDTSGTADKSPETDNSVREVSRLNKIVDINEHEPVSVESPSFQPQQPAYTTETEIMVAMPPGYLCDIGYTPSGKTAESCAKCDAAGAERALRALFCAGRRPDAVCPHEGGDVLRRARGVTVVADNCFGSMEVAMTPAGPAGGPPAGGEDVFLSTRNEPHTELASLPSCETIQSIGTTQLVPLRSAASTPDRLRGSLQASSGSPMSTVPAPVVKRKRGRPRKVPVLDPEALNDSSAPSTLAHSSVKTLSAPLEKRKRGRPRKVPTADPTPSKHSETPDTVVDSVVVETLKRKIRRGRVRDQLLSLADMEFIADESLEWGMDEDLSGEDPGLISGTPLA